jgi:betaine-aldehyde dehydrogenase
MLTRDRFFIDGGWVEPAGSDLLDVVFPFTEEIVARVPAGTSADVHRAVAAARRSFDDGTWRLTPPAERGALLRRAADMLEARSDELAELIITEMGSPRAFVDAGQVPGPLGLLRYYADLAGSYGFEEERSGGGNTSLVVHEPVGVVGGIVPSNFPLLLAMSQIAGALAAGCSIVLKPAPESPLDTFVVAEVFEQLGLPAGVLNIVPGDGIVGEALVSHPDVDKIAFTGSTAAGKRIAGICAKRLARVSLELGGKSAAIVLDDAELDSVVPDLLPSAFLNSGQACVAMTRLLVSRARHDEFVDAFGEAVEAIPVGDPRDPDTVVGPLIGSRQRERVEGYLTVGQDEGAKVRVGGRRPADQPTGWFVEPTVFVGVDNSMRIAREEIFGPVVCVIPYDDVDDAVRIANDSDYGLSGSVWTADADAAIDVARRVRTGAMSVNGAFHAPDAPFGGFKASGLGRECGPEGLELYLETKSIGLQAG